MIGEKLPEEMLARALELPRKPASVVLEGTRVRLEPLVAERDAEALYAVSHGQPLRVGDREIDAYDADDLIWRYLPYGPFANPADMALFLHGLADTPDTLAMRVSDVAAGTPVGVATFMSNHPEHLKIELGSIWYSPVVQRTGANTEATWLMLRHVFGLGYRRVEWKCNALNERSRHAALRMGFQFECVQEAHLITKGRNRDTAWYRILDHEWPAVDNMLRGMLAT